eukprot:CAMPEP_0174364310 /NCGR_PEP_ID=MMETSP0811_2-20130205/72405_1 /TAXON_ID=73025 ORGANISM="Eutreptiella gymnastica-like, Strain CCMP1594" /NCGR_SAMPLE_ID=MMETSP0811_2 /ASSEMBLY_ACC=CAM_ASM_000667 /LENGTH=90 /DNA_ID=CAMNT_0015503827 /DNA_START=266 /DNA_END=539 /DNA_ORIENTATION=+
MPSHHTLPPTSLPPVPLPHMPSHPSVGNRAEVDGAEGCGHQNVAVMYVGGHAPEYKELVLGTGGAAQRLMSTFLAFAPCPLSSRNLHSRS